MTKLVAEEQIYQKQFNKLTTSISSAYRPNNVTWPWWSTRASKHLIFKELSSILCNSTACVLVKGTCDKNLIRRLLDLIERQQIW